MTRSLCRVLLSLASLPALLADTNAPAMAPQTTMQFLERRIQYQRASVAGKTAYHGFGFTNRVESSGIRFQHRIVDDAGRDYKAVQYDHGNAVAAADVDGDGRTDLYFTSQLGRNELWRNLGGG